jgi:hypothetical protein
MVTEQVRECCLEKEAAQDAWTLAQALEVHDSKISKQVCLAFIGAL